VTGSNRAIRHLIGAAVTLAAVGAVAGWPPAWRASRIDPAEVLRES
jgi:ABC-type lipoprotein release transport system permease subunit